MTKSTKNKKVKSTTDKILETNIKNLRTSLTSLSMEQFVASTIESLMQVEPAEYLEINEKDKGNGFYGRSLKSLSKNCLLVNVPRTRENDFSPLTLELAKMGGGQIDELCLSLYKKGEKVWETFARPYEIFSTAGRYISIRCTVPVGNKWCRHTRHRQTNVWWRCQRF